MRIFISWSGNLSQRVALILRDWLPNVIQTVDLYVSSEDIDKGTRWASDISKELEGASLGIICLTRSNLAAPWILFEAGALSKSIEKARVVPLLIDISPSDVEGPLVQFQASAITEQDIRKMVENINESMGDQSIDPKRIERSFEKWWPDLERSFQEAKSREKESTAVVSVRSERELLEETLELARQISKGGDADAYEKLVVETHALTLRFGENIENSVMRAMNKIIGMMRGMSEMKDMPAIRSEMSELRASQTQLSAILSLEQRLLVSGEELLRAQHEIQSLKIRLEKLVTPGAPPPDRIR